MSAGDKKEVAFDPRPSYDKKFKPIKVKELIHGVLQDKLQGQAYSYETVSQWTKDISEEIKAKLKELNLERYKFVVQVVIGEQRGEGVRMGCRCFWDPECDNFVQDTYMNETLFCTAAAFAVYYY